MFHRPLAYAVATCLLASPAATAETDHAALRDASLTVLEAQFGAFRDAAQNLSAASVAHCRGDLGEDEFVEVFRAAWLAWAPLDAYQFGPVEKNAAVLKIAFWPDKKDYVGRGLTALLSQPADALADPDTIAAHSAAVQGLPAIERLVFTDLDACPAIIGISANLESISETLFEEWFSPGGYADLARSAGPENPAFATEAEFTKLLFTAIDFGLTRIADARLGRPLGAFDKPMPQRSEAWRSGLSLEIIDAQLAGLRILLAQGFGGNLAGPDTTWVAQAIDAARHRIDGIGAPLDQAVVNPMTRVRAEALQTRITELQHRIAAELGSELGVDSGFSAADGD